MVSGIALSTSFMASCSQCPVNVPAPMLTSKDLRPTSASVGRLHMGSYHGFAEWGRGCSA